MPQGLWHFERGARLAAGTCRGRARTRFEALAQRLGGTELMAVRLPPSNNENALVFA
ncbi:MAG: hypothetical protein H6988_05105 [Pseudomonadales bacterium]|nr:hypothetical protein [Pseudomonadales bacterium]